MEPLSESQFTVEPSEDGASTYFTLQEFCSLTGYTVTQVAELIEVGVISLSEFHDYPALSSAYVAAHVREGRLE
ncbi:MAG: hypothetical protein ACAI37_18440 [Chthoniobacter sp.]